MEIAACDHSSLPPRQRLRQDGNGVAAQLQLELAPNPAAADQLRLAKYPQVMRQKRRRDVQPLAHLTRRRVLLCKLLHDRQPPRVGERTEGAEQIECRRRDGVHFNHD